MNALLADIVLIAHFLFVAFVVGGLAVVWIGAAAGWAWVRNFWFRAAHLAEIMFVACEALAGVWCPLTFWEDALRGVQGEKNSNAAVSAPSASSSGGARARGARMSSDWPVGRGLIRV